MSLKIHLIKLLEARLDQNKPHVLSPKTQGTALIHQLPLNSPRGFFLSLLWHLSRELTQKFFLLPYILLYCRLFRIFLVERHNPQEFWHKFFQKSLKTNLSIEGFKPKKLLAPLTVLCDFKCLLGGLSINGRRIFLEIDKPLPHLINSMVDQRNSTFSNRLSACNFFSIKYVL